MNNQQKNEDSALSSKDLKLGVLAGMLAGVLMLPILANVGMLRPDTVFGALFGVPAVFALGLFIVKKLAWKFLWMYQFAKFVVVGFMNTVLDFGILNLLSWSTGIYSGKEIILLNTASFSVAIINSYFWNKFWTFGSEKEVEAREFIEFIVIGIGGLAINTAIVYGVTTYTIAPDGVSPALFENIAKVFATAASLIWNFTGYKFIVFKR